MERSSSQLENLNAGPRLIPMNGCYVSFRNFMIRADQQTRRKKVENAAKARMAKSSAFSLPEIGTKGETNREEEKPMVKAVERAKTSSPRIRSKPMPKKTPAVRPLVQIEPPRKSTAAQPMDESTSKFGKPTQSEGWKDMRGTSSAVSNDDQPSKMVLRRCMNKANIYFKVVRATSHEEMEKLRKRRRMQPFKPVNIESQKTLDSTIMSAYTRGIANVLKLLINCRRKLEQVTNQSLDQVFTETLRDLWWERNKSRNRATVYKRNTSRETLETLKARKNDAAEGISRRLSSVFHQFHIEGPEKDEKKKRPEEEHLEEEIHPLVLKLADLLELDVKLVRDLHDMFDVQDWRETGRILKHQFNNIMNQLYGIHNDESQQDAIALSRLRINWFWDDLIENFPSEVSRGVDFEEFLSLVSTFNFLVTGVQVE